MTGAASVSIHHYPLGALRGDYIRAGIGLALTAGPLLFIDAADIARIFLGVLALIFAGFGARTALRQWTRIELSDEDISLCGLNRVRLAWSNLGKVKLRYFSTKHDHSGGWMQLSLSARGRSLTLESSIEGFVDIATRAARAAETNRLELSRATLSNFEALGIAFRANKPDRD